MAPALRVFCILSTLLLRLSIVQTQVIDDGPSPYGIGFAPDVVDFDYENANSTYFDYGPPELEQPDDQHDKIKRAARDFYLRIMPLGASFTFGAGSTDGNGYRKLLRQQLRWKGWKVNMVGSLQGGTMADNVCAQIWPTAVVCKAAQLILN